MHSLSYKRNETEYTYESGFNMLGLRVIFSFDRSIDKFQLPTKFFFLFYRVKIKGHSFILSKVSQLISLGHAFPKESWNERSHRPSNARSRTHNRFPARVPSRADFVIKSTNIKFVYLHI